MTQGSDPAALGHGRERLIGRPVQPLVGTAGQEFPASASGLQVPSRRQEGSEFSASVSGPTNDDRYRAPDPGQYPRRHRAERSR
jgi:hypothetical protein